jgi:hypothetical protein
VRKLLVVVLGLVAVVLVIWARGRFDASALASAIAATRDGVHSTDTAQPSPQKLGSANSATL